MSEKTLPSPVNRDGEFVGTDDLGQLLRNVREHVVMRRVGGFSSVEIVSSADTEIPMVLFPFDAGTTRRGVWEEERYSLFCSRADEAALFSADG